MSDENAAPEVLLAYRLGQAEKHIEQQDKDIDDLRDEVRAIKSEAAKLEQKRLMWGISSLGAVVMTLASVIWAYRGVIFK